MMRLSVNCSSNQSNEAVRKIKSLKFHGCRKVLKLIFLFFLTTKFQLWMVANVLVLFLSLQSYLVCYALT